MKFEYIVVNMEEITQLSKDFFKSQQTVLNEMGAQGWELVHVYEKKIFYLKRLLSM